MTSQDLPRSRVRTPAVTGGRVRPASDTVAGATSRGATRVEVESVAKPRLGRPAAHTPRPDSRRRLLLAAGHEFAEHGFAGASVDRIARRARLNKAMIYYHFRSKAGLYREVLREMYRAVGTKVRALSDSAENPHDALAAFVATVVHEASQRAYFPRVMMRELADRARHLDRETLTLAIAIPEVLAGVIARGVKDGTFRPVHPALAYFTIIGSILAFFGSSPIRMRLTSGPLRGAGALDADALAAHCQHTMRALLAHAPPGPPVQPLEIPS